MSQMNSDFLFWWHHVSTVLNMLEDVHHQCPIVKYLITDVLVDHMHMGLPYLHLAPWLLRNLCYIDKDSFPQSVRQWWG